MVPWTPYHDCPEGNEECDDDNLCTPCSMIENNAGIPL